jgi:hypothetical protein
LYRDGVKLFDFLPAVLSFSDTGLIGGRKYTYTIYGRTEDYRYGPQSLVEATTNAAAVTGFTCLNPGAHPVVIDFAWNAVANATGYNLYYKVNDVDPLYLYSGTGATSISTSCGENTAFGWYVTALGSWGEGPLAGPVRVASGHYEQRNINSLHYAVNPATASWRSSGGWGQFGGDNVFQGAYGSSGYYDGVMTHNGTGFQDWVRANYGQAVLDHLYWNDGPWTECAVYLQRVPGSGYTTGGMTPRINVSSAVAWQTGGPHSYAGGYVGGAISDNQGAWFFMPAYWSRYVLCHTNVGGTGVCYSFMTEWDTHEAYMQFYGASYGGSHTQLSARASWNFVTVNQQNSYYW